MTIDCNDCDNRWLKKNPDLLKQFQHLGCSNNKLITDQANFENCDAYELLKPCEYEKYEHAIYCGGPTAFNLKEVFKNVSDKLPSNKKHFLKFYLSNTAIEELDENVLDEVTFKEIWIQDCHNLIRIHRNAFNKTNLVTDNGIHSK